MEGRNRQLVHRVCCDASREERTMGIKSVLLCLLVEGDVVLA
jgi:hypothetical protein